MKRLFFVFFLVLCGGPSAHAVVENREALTLGEPASVDLLKRYGSKLCDALGCLHIGRTIEDKITYELEAGKLLVKPASYQTVLWVDKDSLEIRAQVRAVTPTRPDSEVPDLMMMIDRGADGILDAVIHVPFYAERTSDGYSVSAFPELCWDARAPSFCGRGMSDEQLAAYQRMYLEAVGLTVKFYIEAVRSLEQDKQ